MREIGVRDLKKSLSEVLHRVDAGEPVRVTRRGRPVADILPSTARPVEERLRVLVAGGRLTLPAGKRPARAPRLVRGKRSATAIVLAEREEER
jgi:prevent-host-death family protein